MRVTALELLPPGAVDVARFLPSVGDVAPYWALIDGWRREIAKPRLAHVLSLFYDDADFRHRYEMCPGSVVEGGHHAALGGLLQHTVEVGTIARTIARACGADRDLVIAGALLHDIGKLETYNWESGFNYTRAHHLAGHVVLGALMFERRFAAAAEPPCTELERDLLRHLILSHHGRLEFGSPVAPLTLEAEVLHWADHASARTAAFTAALRDPAAFEEGDGGVSLRRFWQLDHRRVFRGAADWGALR
jgi:3'-5' exoribonuclease